jgi:hypothetical protein
MLVQIDHQLVHAAPLAKCPDEDIDRLPEYEEALRLMQSAVANGRRDLAASEAAQAALDAMKECSGSQEPADIDALKAKAEECAKHVEGWRADAEKYQGIDDERAQRDERIAQAAKAHRDVLEWLAIADALAPDGIPGELLSEALEPINERLTQSAEDAQWFDVTVTSDMQVLADGRPYALLSESEKWRADAMIAEAISHASGLSLLVLDRFDVLDLQGRSELVVWLDKLAREGAIKTALIFGALKELPANLPKTFAAIWIENGAIQKELSLNGAKNET